MQDKLYHYKAFVESVYDGDTYTVVIDAGFNMSLKQNLRLSGVNTPELRGDDKVRGVEVRDYVSSLILGKTVFVRTVKVSEKYGRYLADVFFQEEENGPYINLGERLIALGKGVPYMVKS